VQITFKRVAALTNPPISPAKEKLDPAQYIFNNCPIIANITLSASLQNLANWSVKTSLDIERPSKENNNLNFLSRYSLMIAILESMRIEYHVHTK
jgi:hypothetical protein